MGFSYADLFAGIGGFHAALSALGGECRFVSEIDDDARAVYGHNWGATVPQGKKRRPLDADIIPLTEKRMLVPKTDILAAGFPCQPFSKSGFQRGIDETRGTLFYNILRVIKERRPPVVLLENVRNLAGPRHAETWSMIVRQLRDAGYKVSSSPTVFSPHFLPPDRGGAPQVRDRVFICGTYVGSMEEAWRLSSGEPVVPRGPVEDTQGVLWDPNTWDLAKTELPFVGGPLLDEEGDGTAAYGLSLNETEWINLWDDFVTRMWEARDGDRLPGFPLWADEWKHGSELDQAHLESLPSWKATFLIKNARFFAQHQRTIESWRSKWFADPNSDQDVTAWTTRNGVYVPPSRRKMEWQAQDAASLWDCILHLRPSGIRAKRPTYLPALVAITQTSIIGPRRRRLTPTEAARLQGLPDWFDFNEQGDAATYKQLGNGVSVGAAYHVIREHVRQDRHLIKPRSVVETILSAPEQPIVPVPAGHPNDSSEAKGSSRRSWEHGAASGVRVGVAPASSLGLIRD